MSDQWYYQAFGQEFGPFAEEELARMLSTGELTADDDVRQGSSGPWKRAGSVQALVSLASSVAVETAEVATDIDSFLLVDEQEAPPPSDESDVSPADLEFTVDTPLAEAGDLDAFTATETPEPEKEPAVWYFQTLGTELGPVPLSDLVKLVERGELSSSDAIRMGTVGDWITAGEIPELFPNGPKLYTPPPQRSAPPPRSRPPESAPVLPPSIEPFEHFESSQDVRDEGAWDTRRKTPAVAAQAWTAASPETDINWYYYLNDQEIGPVTIGELQALAVSGYVTAEVYVKYSAQGEWLLAAEVPNLLPSTEPAPATPSQVVFVPVPPPVAAAPALSLADAERSELVQQLFALLKQEGLQTALLGNLSATKATPGAGWYCNISGSVMGPVTIESLVQMVLQKRIFPDDLIRLGDSGEWFPASSVPDLFPSSAGGKKGAQEDELSVMARIDQMYQEAQEAKAKAEAAAAANPQAKSNEPSRAKMADAALRDINAKIARGKTEEELAAERREKWEQFFGGVKLDRRAFIVLGVLGAIGGIYLLMPILLANVIAGAGYDKLVVIYTKLTADKAKGIDTAGWDKKAKEIIKNIDSVAKSVKGGKAGSAKRDVARMANYLKEMVRYAVKKAPVRGAAGAKGSAEDDYARSLKHFQDYMKNAAKKLKRKLPK